MSSSAKTRELHSSVAHFHQSAPRPKRHSRQQASSYIGPAPIPSRAQRKPKAMATMDESDETVVARYLVTKISWRGSYRRILTISSACLATYNPETFQCTNQWHLSEIEDVNVLQDRGQFMLRLEKARFRWAKVRFQCHARAHFLTLMHSLRRFFTFQPIRFSSTETSSRPVFRCTEHYADDTYSPYLLEIGVAGILLLDERGRNLSTFPYLYLQRIAVSTAHPDGIVISLPSHERLFLCHPRDNCLYHIAAAMRAVGIEPPFGETPLNVQLLRLRNSQLLDHPSLICFDVHKVSDDGKTAHDIQLIIQGGGLVEVHTRMRIVIYRPFKTLVSLVRSEWDDKTVVLEFTQGETLVIRLQAREQFIALVLLVCREGSHDHVELTTTTMKQHRQYHPHRTESDNMSEITSISMEMFFLRRILQTNVRQEETLVPERGVSAKYRIPQSTEAGGSWLQRRKLLGRRRYEARHSSETGETMNDHLSVSVAVEELNANVELKGLSAFCHKEVLNQAIDLLAQHLSLLVNALRHYLDPCNTDIVITLQALVRLFHLPHAFFSDSMIPRVADALVDLLLSRDSVTCYWCMKLLQCFFEPHRIEFSRGQRGKVLQYFVEHRQLVLALVQLLPNSAPSAPANVCGYWMKEPAPEMPQHTILESKDAKLEKDMNIVFYEALFTLQHLVIHLRAHGTLFNNATADQRNVIAQQKHAVATQLLQKHQFLLDSVVDLRLVRSSQCTIALINFVVHEFTTTRMHRRGSTGAVQPPPNNLPPKSVGVAGLTPSSARRRAMNTRRRSVSNPNNIAEQIQEVFDRIEISGQYAYEVRQLQIFLERCTTGAAVLSNRSALFPAQNTFLMPLSGFSRDSSSLGGHIDLNDSRFHVSGKNVRLTVEQLGPKPIPKTISIQHVTKPNMPRPPSTSPPLRTTTASPPTRTPSSSSSPLMHPSSDEDGSGFSVFARSSLDLSRDKKPAREPRARAHSVAAVTRATAHTCDACIGCNDVCGNTKCFFCAQKEFQLRRAFAASSEDATPRGSSKTRRRPQWEHRFESSQSSSLHNVDRKYSSCEVMRHQTKKSCWVVADGNVYDVTDLLGSHPGGMNALLEAAVKGTDCAPIMAKHPSSARRVLANYRLGAYYRCERRTLLA